LRNNFRVEDPYKFSLFVAPKTPPTTSPPSTKLIPPVQSIKAFDKGKGIAE